jgi:hypothetical protein
MDKEMGSGGRLKNKATGQPTLRRASRPLNSPKFVSTGEGRIIPVQPGGNQVDVVFIFDTTGSMSDKRDGLVSSMSSFVDDLSSLALDWRTACVPFGDLFVAGDRIDGDLPFVSTVQRAKDQLALMPPFNGGGNGGESSIEAMRAAFAKPFRPETIKVLVLLTDDYAHGASETITRELVRSETICFVASPDASYYRKWATSSGGKWREIRDRMDLAEILAFLRGLLTEVVATAAKVNELGSVRKYIELEAGET